jgi:AcrR family transcriptional regulator
MATTVPAPSARRQELLERAYRYVLDHGLADMSLRPMAAAIGSSPRVLLFLFGSKDDLVRALLARARADELALLARLRASAGASGGAGAGRDHGALNDTAAAVWGWLTAADHRSLLRVWVESYAKSLTEPDGPWAGFARSTVDDWLALLAAAQPPEVRDTPGGEAQRTLVLAVLRGALLDLLATGEVARPTRAVKSFLRTR